MRSRLPLLLILAVSFLAFVSVNATASPGGGVAVPFCNSFYCNPSSHTHTGNTGKNVVTSHSTLSTPCSQLIACSTATSQGAPITAVTITSTPMCAIGNGGPCGPTTITWYLCPPNSPSCSTYPPASSQTQLPCNPSNPYCSTYPPASSRTGTWPCDPDIEYCSTSTVPVCPVGVVCSTYTYTSAPSTFPLYPCLLATCTPSSTGTPTLPPPVTVSIPIGTPLLPGCSGSTCTPSSTPTFPMPCFGSTCMPSSTPTVTVMSSAIYSSSSKCEINSTSTIGASTTILCEDTTTVQDVAPITSSPAIVVVVLVVVAAAGGGAVSMRRRRPVV